MYTMNIIPYAYWMSIEEPRNWLEFDTFQYPPHLSSVHFWMFFSYFLCASRPSANFHWYISPWIDTSKCIFIHIHQSTCFFSLSVTIRLTWAKINPFFKVHIFHLFMFYWCFLFLHSLPLCHIAFMRFFRSVLFILIIILFGTLEPEPLRPPHKQVVKKKPTTVGWKSGIVSYRYTLSFYCILLKHDCDLFGQFFVLFVYSTRFDLLSL